MQHDQEEHWDDSTASELKQENKTEGQTQEVQKTI